MDPGEVFEFLKFTSDWKPERDVFALKYFVPFTATTAALCASSINKHFRKAVKLKGQGFISSFLPIIVLPAVLGSLSHTAFVVKPALSDKRNYCSVCIELRSGFIALFAGIIYPGFLAPVTAFVNAERYYTYALPSVYKQPLACAKEALRMYKPYLPKLGLLALFQMISGMALVHLEVMNFNTVMAKTLEMDSFVQERRTAGVQRMEDRKRNANV